MKKILLVLTIAALSLVTNAQVVNIPDSNFKSYLVENTAINTNSDTEIQVSEAIAFTGQIDCASSNINDLTGIEAFVNLTDLRCEHNNLTTLDVSQNTDLTILLCYYNDLTSLNVIQNTQLTQLSCNSNLLTSLDVSQNIALTHIQTSNNQISNLNVSQNTALTFLNCHTNNLTSLDISSNSLLTTLYAQNNQLQYFNAANGNNSNFLQFNATNNSNLTCIEVDDITYSNTNWTNIDVSTSFSTSCPCVVIIPDSNFRTYLVGNSAINTNGNAVIECGEAQAFSGTMNCANLSITDLTGIEAFINLNSLFCNNNSLIHLDLSANTVLTQLSTQYNNISTLDLSNNLNLGFITANSNSITSMDLSNHTSLVTVRFDFNNLTGSLDVSNSPSLHTIRVTQNDLTSLNVANGNNSNFLTFQAGSNPNLTCIEVDNVAYSTANWTSIGANTSFSTSCVPVCLVNIPDANFKAYLLGNSAINTNSDTEIQCSEASAFSGTINSNNLAISDLTGIEAFTSLDKLSCHHNSLTSLNLDSNTVLREVYCHNNSIATFEFSLAANLSKIYCYNNSLNTLDVSSNYLLAELSCGGNNLSSINLLSNIFLTTLQFSDNTISSIDLSGNSDLFQLNCNDNNLTSLDVSGNTSLQYLHCYNNQLSNIDVSLNTSLAGFTCNDNQLTSLNVANGNNTNISNSSFKAGNNPNLTCIEVDDTTYSNTTWTNIDANASFSENCGPILTNTISVQGLGGVATIAAIGGTLQMEANLLPLNADDDTYTWSVTNGTGSASISTSGLLTAITDGTVEVTATANDGSGVSGAKTITISNQTVGISTIAFQNLSIYPNPTNGFINLTVSEKVHIIRIMDITGKLIKNFSNKETKLNISEFTAGIYFLEIANPEKKSIFKIIKK